MTKEEMLKMLIKEKYGTQKNFSDKTGIAQTTLSSMLNKGVDGSSVNTVLKVCKALGITVEELCNGTEGDRYVPENIAAHFVGEEYTEEDMADIKKAIELVKAIKRK